MISSILPAYLPANLAAYLSTRLPMYLRTIEPVTVKNMMWFQEFSKFDLALVGLPWSTPNETTSHQDALFQLVLPA